MSSLSPKEMLLDGEKGVHILTFNLHGANLSPHPLALHPYKTEYG